MPCGVRDLGRDEAVRGRVVYLELVDVSEGTVFGTVRVGPMLDERLLPQSDDGICPKVLLMLVIQNLKIVITALLAEILNTVCGSVVEGGGENLNCES